jgi:hypothetical protein
MILPSSERKILKYIKNKYIREHGSQLSYLGEFTIFILDSDLKEAVPELYGQDPELTELKSACRELANRKLIKVHGNYRNLSITKDGFTLASKGLIESVIEYFNSNPGWAVLISLVSLVVAVIALFKPVVT